MAVVRERLILAIPVLTVVCLVAVFFKSFDFGPRSVLPSALIGKPFPAFESETLDPAKKVTNRDLLGERKLVNVWGTWCVACELEHKLLLEIASQGIRIVGLNYKDNPNEARRWLQHRGDPYEFNIVDPEGRLGIELGVYGAPSTFVLDSDGTIIDKHVGQLTKPSWLVLRDTYFSAS